MSRLLRLRYTDCFWHGLLGWGVTKNIVGDGGNARSWTARTRHYASGAAACSHRLVDTTPHLLFYFRVESSRVHLNTKSKRAYLPVECSVLATRNAPQVLN